VLFKLSHPFAGARVPAAAAGPPPSSSLLRRFSKPRDLPGTFSGSHGSSPCSTWLSPGLSLTAVELPVGAPPLLRRRRSPEPSPVDPPPPIGRRWAQSTIPVACLRGRAPPHRRRAGSRRQARGYSCEDFKSSRVPCARRFFLVLRISPSPCKID
jgi:hypothetical protein